MTAKKIHLVLFFFATGICCFSQSKIDSILANIDPQKWSASIEKKADKLQARIIAKSQKTLSKLQRQEEKIYRRLLTTKDSVQAQAALSDIKTKYAALQDKIKNPSVANAAKHYIPRLDSLNTALKFLDQNGITGKVKDALSITESLQSKFQQAEDIKTFIRQRKQQLKEQLEQLGLVKQLKKFNKEVYYYSVQIKEYKELLNDSKKAERKALELLSKTKLFQDFFRKNSGLASLFRLPGGDPNDPSAQTSLAGLQTRSQVNNLIQQQLAAGGPNAMDQFRQNISEAQNQLTQLKNKMNQFGGGSSDDIMPEGFRPSSQKTKSFFRRLEYGTNVETQRATSFFPITSDFGISIGYRLNDYSVIGVGASYKMGWGRGWNNIRISNEGVGLRSFVDWKIKGSVWITGGYEQNYKTAFRNFSQLREYSVWATSGLIGLSKVLSLKTKFFKKTKLQMLWDFLSYQQIPRTQPVLFRVGYNF